MWYDGKDLKNVSAHGGLVSNAFTTGHWGCVKEVRSYVGVPFGALGDEKSACHGPNTKRMARRGCGMTEKTSRMYLHTGAWFLNAFTTGRWGCVKEVRSYRGVRSERWGMRNRRATARTQNGWPGDFDKSYRFDITCQINGWPRKTPHVFPAEVHDLVKRHRELLREPEDLHPKNLDPHVVVCYYYEIQCFYDLVGLARISLLPICSCNAVSEAMFFHDIATWLVVICLVSIETVALDVNVLGNFV